MKYRWILILTLATSGCAGDKATPVATVNEAWVELTPDRPIGPVLTQRAAAAIAAGKKPFAYLHADWCPPCQAIAATRATDPRMKDAFASVVILGIDVDKLPGDEIIRQNLDTTSIPVFFRLDATGVSTGDRLDGGAWGDNVPENMAPRLKAFFAK